MCFIGFGMLLRTRLFICTQEPLLPIVCGDWVSINLFIEFHKTLSPMLCKMGKTGPVNNHVLSITSVVFNASTKQTFIDFHHSGHLDASHVFVDPELHGLTHEICPINRRRTVIHAEPVGEFSQGNSIEVPDDKLEYIGQHEVGFRKEWPAIHAHFVPLLAAASPYKAIQSTCAFLKKCNKKQRNKNWNLIKILLNYVMFWNYGMFFFINHIVLGFRLMKSLKISDDI